MQRWLSVGSFRERRRRRQQLDPFKPYLLERWQEGETHGTVLLDDIRRRGYRGGATMMWNLLHVLWPRSAHPPPAAPSVQPPAVRRCAYRVVRSDTERTPDERTYLEALGAVWPDLA